MSRPPEDDLYYELFNAKHTTGYLQNYMDEHHYAGQSLRDRIEFCFKVDAIKKTDAAWIVTGDTALYRPSKVIVVSGLTSTPNFWDVIAPNVHAHVNDIIEVRKKLTRLAKGEEVMADALLCGTGWTTTSFDFFDPQTLVKLGLPHKLEDEPPEQTALWSQLENQADPEILKQFPMLAFSLECHHKSYQVTLYRLYNGIAPLNDDSIAFLGYFNCANYFKSAECQAIWATAFLDGKLELLTLEARQTEIAYLNASHKGRYLFDGELGNSVAFESNFYLDKLLHEVGLSSHLRR